MHPDIDLILPEWLDACKIADSLVEAAYEGIVPSDRAILKKTIASLHSFYGERVFWSQCSRQVSQGFLATATNTATPYVLLFCDSGYPYPQSYLAALMPAIFAGVSHIFPCFVTPPEEAAHTPLLKGTCCTNSGDLPSSAGKANKDKPHSVSPSPFLPGPSGFSDAMLTALDLAGVEQLFQLEQGQAVELLVEMVQANGAGRVIIVGDKDWLDNILLKAARLFVPCFCLPALPEYTLCETSTVHACQTIKKSALFLDSCNQDIWIWPSLSLDWFQNTVLHISGK